MRKLFLVVASSLLLVAAGCQPQVDLAAEQAAIQQASVAWLEATNQPGETGADGYASYGTEDAIFMPPNGPRLNGRQAISDWAMQYTGAEGFTVSWEATTVEVASDGSMAYATGTYELSFTDAQGNAVSDQGKFVNIWKKQADASWKVSVAIWNSNQPAMAPSETMAE